jgi:hypothetical protein
VARLANVEAALVEIHERFRRPRILLDPWQGIGAAQRLRGRGLSIEEWSFTTKRYAEGAQALFALLRDGLLALYPDDALLDELANIRLRETSPGLLRVDHDPDRHDDMAVALSFAVVPLVERTISTGTGTSLSGPAIPRGPGPVVAVPWAPPEWCDDRRARRRRAAPRTGRVHAVRHSVVAG